MTQKKWFMRGVKKKPPYTLGGWSKSQKAVTRRRKALASRPRNWTMKHRYLSAGRACTALSNVTSDSATERMARADARYFFSKLK